MILSNYFLGLAMTEGNIKFSNRDIDYNIIETERNILLLKVSVQR